ncbi:hypothetical protein [Paenibacillus sp. 23TSA30-6]|uniref:hypothetical protein n=1 Tax=Paenibacillus sp. 23TSA30-6 TaxID=2546104 RepID=UPI001787DEA9|nr:hypothetical protein [Paenibacillus sp. 23TSA30-6]
MFKRIKHQEGDIFVIPMHDGRPTSSDAPIATMPVRNRNHLNTMHAAYAAIASDILI